MNSNRQIEVDKTRCNSCQNIFYEFKGHELDACPHCKKALDFKGSCHVEDTLDIKVEVDYKTGKILVNNEKINSK